MRISDWSSDVCSSDLPGARSYAPTNGAVCRGIRAYRVSKLPPLRRAPMRKIVLLYLPAVLVLLAPTLGHAASCSDNVDVNATVLANGFAADLANTRQFSSQIDAANVATLQLAWADVAAGITARRGAPAVTPPAEIGR